jgi:hypothetical protein
MLEGERGRVEGGRGRKTVKDGIGGRKYGTTGRDTGRMKG